MQALVGLAAGVGSIGWGKCALAVHTIGSNDEASSWLLWVVTLVIAGGLGAIMFKNAKRSHRD